MTIEDQVRTVLQERARTIPVRDDLADVTRRSARRVLVQRRVLGGALAAALVLGPIAGYATARATTSHDDKVVAGANAPAVPGKAGITIGGSSSGTWQRLFVRTTAEGITLRMYRQPTAPPCPSGTTCGRLALLTVEASNRGATTRGDVAPDVTAQPGRFGETMQGPFGEAEGAPGLWVVAEVGSGVHRVRARFADGTSDEMEPVDGVVALAQATTSIDTTLDALADDGHVLVSQPVLGMEPCRPPNCAFSEPATTTTTTPTPSTLPPAGTQPADPAAARADIERAFGDAYTAKPAAVKTAAIEDGDQLTGVVGTFMSGPFADIARQAHARIDAIVFASPTRAAVRYDILAPGADHLGRIGDAVLAGGRWKVARSTFCADLALGGVKCPG